MQKNGVFQCQRMTTNIMICPHFLSPFWCLWALWAQWQETRKEDRKEWVKERGRAEKYSESILTEVCACSDIGRLIQNWPEWWETGMLPLFSPHCLEHVLQSGNGWYDKRSPVRSSICLLSSLGSAWVIVDSRGAWIRIKFIFTEWLSGLILITESSQDM